MLTESAVTTAMTTPGTRSRAVTMGLVIMLFSVSTGMRNGGFGLFLCFVGALVGAILVAVGVHMADDGPARIVLVVSRGVQALVAFLRRNTATVGLFMTSCAFTVISGEENPVLCFGMFTLLLLGLTLINLGAPAE